ncbi:hypothetical protein ONS95_013904 [Cadophora gregata]|uniref:uncharacterized protein n=1 Tax=Cadophora gregata TaxID=51156 RepID=UPI0026DBBF57|nr:uncharacterized protein ONS95_013904 [Cadophora gregata]KAK0113657.1 hypothetical protein ONS96_014513 [Cadophora gregata f. sp. sojae]KAK0114412.1 hypothetical protein ONS95_013904 [Cadophora gregata]
MIPNITTGNRNIVSLFIAAPVQNKQREAQVYPPPSFSLSLIHPKPTNTFVLEPSLSRSTIVVPTPPPTFTLPPKPTATHTDKPPKPTKSTKTGLPVVSIPKPTKTVHPTKSIPKTTHVSTKKPKPTLTYAEGGCCRKARFDERKDVQMR